MQSMDVCDANKRALKHNRDRLVSDLDLDPVIDLIIQNELLSPNTEDAIQTGNFTKREKNGLVVDDLSTGGPRTLDTFCDILMEKKRQAFLAEQLLKDRKKYLESKADTSDGAANGHGAISSSIEPLDREVTLEQMHLVQKLVVPRVTHYWKKFGTFLRIDNATLGTIDRQSQKSAEDCCTEMIELYVTATGLDNQDSAAKRLIKAIEETGNGAFAAELEKEKNIMDSMFLAETLIPGIAPSWYPIGIALKLPLADLDAVKSEVDPTTAKCTKLLTTWLKNNKEKKTWRDIYDAMKRAKDIRNASLLEKDLKSI